MPPVRTAASRCRITAYVLLGIVMGPAFGCSGLRGDDPSALVGSSTTLPVPEGTVIIRGIAYNPATLHVGVGRDVVWRFDDNGVNHTVTADDASFSSGRRTDGEFRRVFDRPGEYAYHCEVHSRMKGTIVVAP